MQLDCSWDTDGAPRAHCAPRYALLAHFLESEVQGSPEACQDILQAIAKIEAGQRKSWQQTGNAHTLSLSIKEACIEAEFDQAPQPCRLSLADLRAALERWQTFLEQPKKGEKA